MSSPMMASRPPQTTSSSPRKGNCSSAKPPPAAHVSYNLEQVGHQYGWVKIISAERRYAAGWRHPYVKTRCVGCGSKAWINLSSLTRGISKGCQQCSQPRQIPRWLDRILTAAKGRCSNKTDKQWVNYGGRGIRFRFSSVLEAGLWILANLGARPSSRHDLGRIDINGNYEPGNLRWATRRQLMNNTRCSVLGEWDYHEAEWPYAFTTTRRLKLMGLSRAEIVDRAALAVVEKRKNWRMISARLAFLTC
jgi:hypothetical protein